MWAYTCLVLASVHLAVGLSCVCSPTECEPIAEDDCPQGAGTVWDPCRCCRICARTENEPCGGPYGFYGSCGRGLECVVSDVMSEGVEGTCRRLPGSNVHCSWPVNVSGCNVIAGSCRCGLAPVCSGDSSPYTFLNLDECSINLNVMKEHARQRDIEELIGHDSVVSSGTIFFHAITIVPSTWNYITSNGISPLDPGQSEPVLDNRSVCLSIFYSVSDDVVMPPLSSSRISTTIRSGGIVFFLRMVFS